MTMADVITFWALAFLALLALAVGVTVVRRLLAEWEDAVERSLRGE